MANFKPNFNIIQLPALIHNNLIIRLMPYDLTPKTNLHVPREN